MDVFKVAGQIGTYIANYEVNQTPRTVISFDKGALWQPLASPEGDICPAGASSCSLHLSLASSQDLLGLPTPLSEVSAGGIILANGYVGASVDTTLDNYALVVSRDGGLTWTRVASVPHVYVILDHGGVLVAASWQRNSDIIFSAQEGLGEWQSLQIAAQKEFLYLTTEDGGGTPFVFVYHVEGYLWHGSRLDFSKLLARPCDATRDDYETWSPGLAVPGGNHCLLGRNYQLDRRNPCKLCYNGLTHESAYEELVAEENKDATPCPCTAQDFHCAPGFFRADPLNAASPCVYDHSYKMEVACEVRRGVFCSCPPCVGCCLGFCLTFNLFPCGPLWAVLDLVP